MNGLKLACLYSYKCTRATSLGINDQLLEYIDNSNLDIVPMIKKLLSYPGYQKISGFTKEGNCFAVKVVRAYWLGDRRGLVELSHNFATLEKFKEINADEHLSTWIIKEMLDCAISFGKVLELSSKKAKILNQRLLYKGGRVVFGAETREVDTRFVANLKEGDLVSIHLAIAREKISKAKTETLKNITKEALRILQIA